MSGPVLALNILFSVLSDATYAVFAGCLFAIHWLNAATAGAAVEATVVPLHVLRRISVACLAGLILSQIIRPWFAAASMSGSGGFAANLVLVPEILSSTHVGKVWYIGSGALAGLLAVLLFAGRQTGARAGGAFAAFLLLIGCAKAASGHAAGQGDFTLAEVSMVLHVTGTAIWAGTVVASGFVALPHLVQFTDPVPFWSYGKLLSRTATWAVLTVLLSGIYTSDRELNGELSGLWRTGWGRILMTKVALVLLALVLGAFARFRCVQCPATKQRAALMVRLVRAEAVVMILILSLSGTLANTAPAMQTAKSRNQQISPSVDSRALSLLDSSSGYAGAR